MVKLFCPPLQLFLQLMVLHILLSIQTMSQLRLWQKMVVVMMALLSIHLVTTLIASSKLSRHHNSLNYHVYDSK